LDLLAATAARRLAAIRELIARAADVERALARPTINTAPVVTARGGRPRRAASRAASATADGSAAPAAAAPAVLDDVVAGDPAASGGGDPPEADEPRDARAPASERRRSATTLVAIWRDLARDLAVAGLGDERLVRDTGLLDELRAASGISTGELTAFLERLDRSGELIEANASPELVLDVLVLSWPRRPRAA
ncbi:MAG TPA: hypothetical protein VK233_11810, partial [Candidatus Dormibacteraeota bacterium]|nr:hypothetical protein [Candidatus Dormibacteraeota bacterium]